MQKTGIEYITHTWNPIAMRCTPISEGCRECWHLRTADRLCKNSNIPKDEQLALCGEGPFIVRERELTAPLKLNKPAVIGVQFMGDLFHENVPYDFIVSSFMTIFSADRHAYLVLTKRIKRAAEILPEIFKDMFTGGPHIIVANNVWPGVTICTQPEADEKIPILLQIPAAHRWISYEPALGPVDFSPWLKISWQCSGCRNYFSGPHKRVCPKCGREEYWTGSHKFNPPSGQAGRAIDGIVCGGETGPGARPMHPEWARSVRDQCQAAGVPFFFKQWGEWCPLTEIPNDEAFNNPIVREAPKEKWSWIEDERIIRIGKKAAGRLLDGREWNELPWVAGK